jgi:uncharacterized protein (TIGR03435 family)
MPELEDIELLREFAERDSQAAFAKLVERHINLIYSTALRAVGNAHAAQEISQAVFIILARKAKSLGAKTILSGWLYQTTRLTAANYMRTEVRRQKHEQEAYMQSTLNESGSEAWLQIAPILDDAMSKLGPKDRDAIVLRFFENKNLNEIGAAIGASEDAAKMRVSRALEKLRKFFSKRGVALTAAIIAGAVSSNSVQAAPVGLTISIVAAAKGSAVTASTLTLVKGALKIMAWSKVKTAIVVCVGVLLAAGTITIAVKEVQAHRTYRGSWQVKDITQDTSLLDRMPPLVQILPTKFDGFNSVSDGIGIRNLRGKMAGLRQSISEIIIRAYGGSSPVRMVTETELPPDEYDFIVTVPGDPMKALQQEIKNQFGFVARHEMLETNVLLLRVKNPNAPGLRPASGKSSNNSAGPDHISVVNDTLWPLDAYLEGYFFKVPVIDQTGLTGRFDYEVKWSVPRNSQHLGLDGLKQALLDQLGLELVPTNMPIEMLVVEKVN